MEGQNSLDGGGRIRKLIPNVLLFCATLLTLELGLLVARSISPRIDYLLTRNDLRRQVDDSILGFRFSPYSPGHDARGFRNQTALQTAEILAIGDSYTYGLGLQNGESWPAVLGRLVDRSVYNAGVVGYGFCEYREVTEQLLSLHPEVVVLGIFTGNDLADTYRAVYREGRCAELRSPKGHVRSHLEAIDADETIAQEAERLGWGALAQSSADAPGGVRHWVAAHSSLYGLARELRRVLTPSPEIDFESFADLPYRISWSADPELRTVFKDPGMFLRTVDLHDPRIREGLRIASEVLVDLKREAETAGASLAVVIIPEKVTTYAPFATDGTLPASFFELSERDAEVAEAFEAVLAKAGIPYVSALPALRARARQGVAVYPETDDHHNNAEGARVIARLVADSLFGATNTE